MQEITTVDELKTLIKEKVLPAYETVYVYVDEAIDFNKLGMDYGICRYCEKILNVKTYELFRDIINGHFIAPTIVSNATKEQAILPRIEWMRKFINS